MNHLQNWVIIIPARLGSTRLPNKPLQDLGGKPLIVQVYNRLLPLAAQGAKIIVATDSDEVVDACNKHGVPSTTTSRSHESGTDRVHEVSQQFTHNYILNVQGDEPYIELDDLISLMQSLENSSIGMGTLVYKNKNLTEFNNPNVVKVVLSNDKKALYFSRSPIPYHRNSEFNSFWQHQGVYAYTRETLSHFCSLDLSGLENFEKLEQLRAIQAGIDILTVESTKPSLGIDTPEDLEHARNLVQT